MSQEQERWRLVKELAQRLSTMYTTEEDFETGSVYCIEDDMTVYVVGTIVYRNKKTAQLGAITQLDFDDICPYGTPPQGPRLGSSKQEEEPRASTRQRSAPKDRQRQVISITKGHQKSAYRRCGSFRKREIPWFL